MRIALIISLLVFSIIYGKDSLAQQDSALGAIQVNTQKPLYEDSLIRAVIIDKSLPDPKKAEYISSFTKYGFKNLFNAFTYSPALPYAGQVNPNAEWFMRDYLKKHGSYLKTRKNSALPYFNLIDNVLSSYGLPHELKYLAVIESDLQISATSPAGAGGAWQFMPATARSYGLIVNNRFDERRDFLKSTHAAARLLLNLYDEMHDWLLVIAAYNGGSARVYSAIQKSGSRDFWILQRFLPEESRNHVKKFIATHYIMEAVDLNNNPILTERSTEINRKLSAEEIQNTNTLSISGKYISKVLAGRIGLSMEDFNHYNPGMDAILSYQGNYELILPKEKMSIFIQNKYSILEDCVNTILNSNEVPPTRTVKPIIEKNKKG